MIIKFIRIITILISFIFLTGFFPLISLLGPSLTVATSGNIYKASGQYFINKSIKSKTGKNSLAYIKEKIQKQDEVSDINQQFQQMVVRRIVSVRKELNFKNINQ